MKNIKQVRSRITIKRVAFIKTTLFVFQDQRSSILFNTFFQLIKRFIPSLHTFIMHFFGYTFMRQL